MKAFNLLPFHRPPLHLPQPLLHRRTRSSVPWYVPRFILDPGGPTVLLWHRIFLLNCMAALFIDPFYFYLMFVAGPACVRIDYGIGLAITICRTVADLFYIAHLVLKFHIAFVAPSSRVFGRGELVTDYKQIRNRYLQSKDFILDLIACIPIPQVVIWYIIPGLSDNRASHTNNLLSLIVLMQYVPRLYLIFPLNKKIVKANGVVTKTAVMGAAYNLLLYMLASHVLGALWYLLSIERQYTCWRSVCNKERQKDPRCYQKFLDCSTLNDPDRANWLLYTDAVRNCTMDSPEFNFGIFADVLTNEIIGATFFEKYLYCLWWGLKNLSSYGQNLQTSTYILETVFAICICIVGLVLFSHLIGNMQAYLQSLTARLEEWRVKQWDVDQWMRHRQLPEDIQDRVRSFFRYKWLATRGVDEESILQSLPLDLRREIQRHLCLALVRRVPFFSQMDDQLLDAICERLVSSLSTKDTYIVREGDPVNEMLFIIRGQLESSTTNGGRSGFYNSINLRPGDFCGEELLTWALMPNPSLNFPQSTRTVHALTEVEAFALRAEDLKFVANQFKRLHSKKLQHAFRFYSYQWRTWGACFIQAAWRRYKKKKLAKELSKQERFEYYSEEQERMEGEGVEEYGYLDEDIDERDEAPLLSQYGGGSDGFTSEGENAHASQHLGATILASKFMKKRVNQRMVRREEAAPSLKKLMKPDEPDFSIQ
ncbi:Cyclic nucleotide-gated channel 18 [Rhynchospora pubera]|uniref:Cyclic nucleotide-gated channel 18 n=1 Tax=Rhynchospora pubera TaxID=906938 RepID=A0AAV8GEZ1_9POAL|nr:Cyclic nucleotide-gated channel 18 [Rhynchospora pubera]